MDFAKTYDKLRLLTRFSLLLDKADNAQIDKTLRGEATLRGSALWVLMLAILIASIGLNTNSTAVIIGAMLISPLMGPIIGVGYGVGVYDFELVKKSLASLGSAVGISLATSALYFALSPLTGEQSELLARTSPTIWDVQIALVGGLAGIIGLTRKEKSNVIPGVAIATALMPPLCTAGFGLASGNWRYFLGAFYLFTINSVFIALAAVSMVQLMGLPRKSYVDKALQARVRRWLFLVALLTALPSMFLAARLVADEIYAAHARAFVAEAFGERNATRVVDVKADPERRSVAVTLVGDVVPQAAIRDIRSRLGAAGLSGTTLRVYQTNDPAAALALSAGKANASALIAMRRALEAGGETVAELKEKLARDHAPWLDAASDIRRELAAQWPNLRDVVVAAGHAGDTAKTTAAQNATAEAGDSAANGAHAATNATGAPDVAVLTATSPTRLEAGDEKHIAAWFAARTKAPSVRVRIDQPPAKKEPVRKVNRKQTKRKAAATKKATAKTHARKRG